MWPGCPKAGPGQNGLARIQISLGRGDISEEEAIDALQSLTLRWRGDRTEHGGLRLLAQLHARHRQYAEAFTIMRNATQSFPDEPIAMQIQDEMRLVFEDLFLRGKADEFRIVEALGIFSITVI